MSKTRKDELSKKEVLEIKERHEYNRKRALEQERLNNQYLKEEDDKYSYSRLRDIHKEQG